MACSWSPENATKAFISTLKMERKTREPNSDEFISALAAGNNAQLIVTSCSTAPNNKAISTLLALVAAAQQTGGQVICIIPNTTTKSQLQYSLKKLASRSHENHIEFVAGDVHDLLIHKYPGADFVVIDCNLHIYGSMVRRIEESETTREKGVMVLGYNAFCKGSSWQWSGLKTHLLPIGDGLLVTKMDAVNGGGGDSSSSHCNRRRGRWVVKVDKCTGEDHVFRVGSRQRKGVVV